MNFRDLKITMPLFRHSFSDERPNNIHLAPEIGKHILVQSLYAGRRYSATRSLAYPVFNADNFHTNVFLRVEHKNYNMLVMKI